MEETISYGEEITQYVSFFLGEEEYGVDISLVHEIIRFPEITRVPQMPEFIDGVINLRGKVIPVMNLRKKFALPDIEQNNKQRIIVIEIDKKVTGVCVDGVSEVMDIAKKQVDPAPKMGTRVKTDFIKGMAKLSDEQLMILLDIEKVLTSEEIAQLVSAADTKSSQQTQEAAAEATG